MLERDMEVAVATCPDLFIEPGLSLIQRQVVINGRRPDILFTDGLSRHLLVELQCGRLDEDHLQRHVYYYIDYRAKYPSTHPRLVFIANRLVPQHKTFLDDHGYEFREIPENDFASRIRKCIARGNEINAPVIEPVETPGVLTASVHEILYDIEQQRMTLSYKMLLLMFMCESPDASGSVPLQRLAESFQEFFIRRATDGKSLENPNAFRDSTSVAARSITQWERVIREMPVAHLTEQFVIDESTSIRWSPRIWSQWNEDLKRNIRDGAFDRLVRYFNKNVPGGF
jgi:hypothetical protein